MKLRFPAGPDVKVDALVRRLRAEPDGGRLTFGDERVTDFLVSFARKLLAPGVARRFPELASLGFFLRRGEIDRALRRHGDRPGEFRSGRGLVFHVPPANVDTIFVYSWALSALAGNHNVVRVSPRSAGAAQAVLDALGAALTGADPAITQSQAMVTYGHDGRITSALSAACDLRVIWGGDASVNAIRHYPLPPYARDLTFPDRASFAAISVDGWQAATPEDRERAIAGFYNDSYWFDQAACSSPRTLFWVGGEPSASAARAEFGELLAAAVVARKLREDAAMAVQKRVATYGVAAEGQARSVRFAGNTVATLELTDSANPIRKWLGTGTFPQATIGSLTDLVDIVERKDQTLSYFGFDRTEVLRFARALSGRGIDRIVPFGAALNFAAVWDGYDLLAEFSRLTTVAM